MHDYTNSTGFIFSKKEFPLTSALDIRFIKKSECLLCPATARIGDTSTHTAYIEILSFVGTQNYKEFFTVHYDSSVVLDIVHVELAIYTQ